MGVLTTIFNTLIILVSIFLICLVLIQRGKGGGLAGAFGGVGGSSAFGTKAGDTFTRITVVTAAVWMLMAMLLVVMTSRRNASTWASDAFELDLQGTGLVSRQEQVRGVDPGNGPGVELAGSRLSLPAGGDKVPAIPKETNFPLTPGTPAKTP